MVKALTVSEFNTIIKRIFDAEVMLHHIVVVGEISDIKLYPNSAYFSLKDENSKLECVCWSSSVFSLLKEGKSFKLTGTPNFYAKTGKFNFNVSKAEEEGEGDLYKKFIELKNALEKEGLFDQSHKKPLPKAIKRIGVVSSREGAVIEDIISVVRRRNPSVDVILFPVKVQGKDAEFEIAHAIEKFSNYEKIDVIIVARGGGSLEDLMAFNTEVVARAVHNCNKPLVSAVGHETDTTIIDFVSDMRAPTPSIAAELVTVDVDSRRRDTKKLILSFKQAITFLTENLKENIIELQEDLISNIETFLRERAHEIELLDVKLKKSDPLAILKMGYAKIMQDGKSIDSVSSVMLSSQLEIAFADGVVTALPKEKKL